MIEKCRRKSCILLVSPLQMATAEKSPLSGIIKKSMMSIIPTPTQSIDIDSDDSASCDYSATVAIAAATVAGGDKNDLNASDVDECDTIRSDKHSTQPKNSVDVKICCTLEMKFIWYALWYFRGSLLLFFFLLRQCFDRIAFLPRPLPAKCSTQLSQH